jgi:uncharacterized protein YggE
MSEDRLRYIEVIGEGPSDSGEGLEEAQRAAFQAARRSAETLAEEADVRITGVQSIAQLAEGEDSSKLDRLRYRVRFGIEPAKSSSSRAGFLVT